MPPRSRPRYPRKLKHTYCLIQDSHKNRRFRYKRNLVETALKTSIWRRAIQVSLLISPPIKRYYQNSMLPLIKSLRKTNWHFCDAPLDFGHLALYFQPRIKIAGSKAFTVGPIFSLFWTLLPFFGLLDRSYFLEIKQ